MNTDEASKILSILTSAYPKRVTRDEGIGLVRLWAAAFSDIPYTEVGEAVMQFIRNDNKGYMPVPGQIYELVDDARRMKQSKQISGRFYDMLQNDALS